MSNEKLLLDSIKTIGEYNLEQDTELEKLRSKLEQIEENKFINLALQHKGFRKDGGIFNFKASFFSREKKEKFSF